MDRNAKNCDWYVMRLAEGDQPAAIGLGTRVDQVSHPGRSSSRYIVTVCVSASFLHSAVYFPKDFFVCFYLEHISLICQMGLSRLADEGKPVSCCWRDKGRWCTQNIQHGPGACCWSWGSQRGKCCTFVLYLRKERKNILAWNHVWVSTS